MQSAKLKMQGRPYVRPFKKASLVKGDSTIRGDVLEEDRGVCRLRLSKGEHEVVEGFCMDHPPDFYCDGVYTSSVTPAACHLLLKEKANKKASLSGGF